MRASQHHRCGARYWTSCASYCRSTKNARRWRKKRLWRSWRGTWRGLADAQGGVSMPKNVVVCCDGTANEFAKHNTNVVKLYSMLQHDSARQVAYYHPGLGTM